MIQRQNAVGLYADDFRKWLESLPAGQDIGLVRINDACPIAEYLRQQRGVERVKVNPSTTVLDDATYFTPAWAKRFIRKVDAAGFPFLKVYQALAILDHVEEDLMTTAERVADLDKKLDDLEAKGWP